MNNDNLKQLHATLNGQFKKVDCQKIDTQILSTNLELNLVNKKSNEHRKYSYTTTNYLASEVDTLFTKVTHVYPAFILVNLTDFYLEIQ